MAVNSNAANSRAPPPLPQGAPRSCLPSRIHAPSSSSTKTTSRALLIASSRSFRNWRSFQRSSMNRRLRDAPQLYGRELPRQRPVAAVAVLVVFFS